ncbi:MAG: rhodanese-like domain-containing protein [Bryobacteraceae bacterium]
MRSIFVSALVGGLGLVAAVFCFAQNGSDPWSKPGLLEPAALAHEITSAKPPTILCVAFPVLYRNRRILHAIGAGPGSKPEGVALLKRAVAHLPKDADIAIYCGCCPMVRCPNVRPAYRTLKQMGFTHVRVLDIPTNMHTDWFTKGYPSEKGGEESSSE